MRAELIEELRQITEEERSILSGEAGVEQTRYTENQDFVIDSKKMLEKGKLIDVRTHTRFVHFPKHRHNYIEIIYMCSGSTTHTINDTSKVVLKEGELLFLNQNAFQEIEAAGENDIAVNFIVLPEFFDVAFEMIESDNVLKDFLIGSLQGDKGGADYIHFKVADALPVQNLVENMVWSIQHRQANNRRINQTTMGLLFLQLLNYTDRIEQNRELQYENQLVLAVLKEIEENYKSANLTEIAERMNQSVYQLSRLVKKSTGSTFKELLQQKRFHKAVELLRNTSLPVADVIYSVGYDNTSYFHRMFREKYGTTPKEFRKAGK
ncbi:MAG: helix-turn-helix domain-containing protein [Lachnospiraceae bacterium]|nr:helix-turn-helix domain-containing protein [Lachnospiraceae bacterium]